MRTLVSALQLILIFLVQSTFAQVALETVYVARQKTTKVIPPVRYYYYPNLLAYYDTCTGQYLYTKDGAWITADFLPSNYRGYSLHNNNYVLLEGLSEDAPYIFIDEHKKKYPANFSSKRKKDNAIVQY